MFPVPFSVTFSSGMFKISHLYMDCNRFVCLLLFSQFFCVIFMQLSQFIPCKAPFGPCDACELFRCKAAPAILQRYDTRIASHFMLPQSYSYLKSAHPSTKNGYFSVFCGSISHAFSCKHETHDLLTLVFITKRGLPDFLVIR